MEFGLGCGHRQAWGAGEGKTAAGVSCLDGRDRHIAAIGYCTTELGRGSGFRNERRVAIHGGQSGMPVTQHAVLRTTDVFWVSTPLC